MESNLIPSENCLNDVNFGMRYIWLIGLFLSAPCNCPFGQDAKLDPEFSQVGTPWPGFGFQIDPFVFTIGPETHRSACCWFVIDNGKGESGYAGADSFRGFIPPDGFMTPELNVFKRTIKAQGFSTIILEFPSPVPPGWKIRNLTLGEVNSLQAP